MNTSDWPWDESRPAHRRQTLCADWQLWPRDRNASYWLHLQGTSRPKLFFKLLAPPVHTQQLETWIYSGSQLQNDSFLPVRVSSRP